jgi:hypothetical protein
MCSRNSGAVHTVEIDRLRIQVADDDNAGSSGVSKGVHGATHGVRQGILPDSPKARRFASSSTSGEVPIELGLKGATIAGLFDR